MPRNRFWGLALRGVVYRDQAQEPAPKVDDDDVMQEEDRSWQAALREQVGHREGNLACTRPT